MANIVPLDQHPHLVETLAGWFEAEWPDYYATQPAGAARASFLDREQRWLVAVHDGQPAGCVALRSEVIGGVDGYTPAIGGLFVPPSHRDKGLGSALVDAAAALAVEGGAKRVYLSTKPARALVERLGWREIASVDVRGERHPIFVLAVIPESRAAAYPGPRGLD